MLWVRTFIASSIYSSISGQVLNSCTISITSAASLAIFQRTDVFQFSPIRSATHALVTLRTIQDVPVPAKSRDGGGLLQLGQGVGVDAGGLRVADQAGVEHDGVVCGGREIRSQQ